MGKSRKWLVAEAGLSASTFEKAMAGQRPFSPLVVFKLEQVLGIVLKAGSGLQSGVAPAWLGSYSRQSVAWLEGHYLALRHSFEHEQALVAYALVIAWDDQRSHLFYLQSDDFGAAVVRRGVVSASMCSGHCCLLSEDAGQHELSILGRPAEGGRLNGLCSTLGLHRGVWVPASSALVLVREQGSGSALVCGLIEPSHPAHSSYADWLQGVVNHGLATLKPRAAVRPLPRQDAS